MKFSKLLYVDNTAGLTFPGSIFFCMSAFLGTVRSCAFLTLAPKFIRHGLLWCASSLKNGQATRQVISVRLCYNQSLILAGLYALLNQLPPITGKRFLLRD